MRQLVQKVNRDNPHLTFRLEISAFLILLRPIVPLGDHHYQIGSVDGLRYYQVLNGHCQSHDCDRHGADHLCEHRLALAMHRRPECSGQLPLSPQRLLPPHGSVIG